jgi:uncharacterized protein (DUF1697 family)
MNAPTHVVLIRGINVGGKNPVPMGRLREALVGRGYGSVNSYIQSGNVVLAAQGDDAAAVTEADVTDDVERLLAEEFGVDTVVVTVSTDTLRRAVAAAPEGFGAEPDQYHYDVAFLRPGLSSADALAACGVREGVDTVWTGDGVVYFRRLSAMRTKSRMSTVMSNPHYKNMTIRNWRTCIALMTMLGGS